MKHVYQPREAIAAIELAKKRNKPLKHIWVMTEDGERKIRNPVTAFNQDFSITIYDVPSVD